VILVLVLVLVQVFGGRRLGRIRVSIIHRAHHRRSRKLVDRVEGERDLVSFVVVAVVVAVVVIVVGVVVVIVDVCGRKHSVVSGVPLRGPVILEPVLGAGIACTCYEGGTAAVTQAAGASIVVFVVDVVVVVVVVVDITIITFIVGC